MGVEIMLQAMPHFPANAVLALQIGGCAYCLGTSLQFPFAQLRYCNADITGVKTRYFEVGNRVAR